MPDKITLFCWVQGDGFDRIFPVDINVSESVGHLKEAIQQKKTSFRDITADSLDLWKIKIPLESTANSALSIKLEDGSTGDVLSVVLPRPPGTTITPSSSNNSNLSQELPAWLVEIHDKLWGKEDQLEHIFCTANLTKGDFIELQHLLQCHDPGREFESYVAKSVLPIKSEFLRARSVTGIHAVGHFITESNGNLVLKLVFDTSQDLTPPEVMDDDALDDDNVDGDALDNDNVDDDALGSDSLDLDDDAMDIDSNSDSGSCMSIDADAVYLSEGATAIFPCTIRYMDLTSLKLKHLTRVPHLMLLRDEWSIMVDIFNKRKKGLRGGAIFTGQPGIGKTCLLYYSLVLCLIRSQPIVFQDMKGEVFYINDKVQRLALDRTVMIPGDDVLTLVDADHLSCVPNSRLLEAVNLRVLLVSSPRKRPDRKWLTQYVGESRAVYVMKPWSREELLVTSLFLAAIDITLTRFVKTTGICGYNPRQCFEAAVSLDTLEDITTEVLQAIKECEKLSDTITKVHTGRPIHRAVQIYPSSQSRRWGSCLVEPVSDWAYFQMIAELRRRGADAAYEFYQLIEGSNNSAGLRGKMFETKLHVYFESIKEPRNFTIRSLDNNNTTFNIEFSSKTNYFIFGATQRFAGRLASSVKRGASCYLKPKSPVFATFDSFRYQHNNSQHDCSPLIGFQVTTADKHPINADGLAKVQRSLKCSVSRLKALRPTKAKKWIILFVVPESIVESFVKQRFVPAKKAAHWRLKTTQYVLGLPEEEVIKS